MVMGEGREADSISFTTGQLMARLAVNFIIHEVASLA